MDDLHRHLFTVMEREWKHGTAAAVDVTLLGRYYERFADHAVEVARRVIFQATGEIRSGADFHAPPPLAGCPVRPPPAERPSARAGSPDVGGQTQRHRDQFGQR